MLGNIGIYGSLTFYDALLPHIARPEELDRVSSAGYALGYLGGGVLLAINLAWIQQPAWFGLPDAGVATRLAFVSVAVWWALFTIPILRRVSEPPVDAATRGHARRSRPPSGVCSARCASCAATGTPSRCWSRSCSTTTASAPSSAWRRSTAPRSASTRAA